jgi:hypothetical protein
MADKNPYFCLTTTLLGINITDTYLLANHHRVINYFGEQGEEKSISIQQFAGTLYYQLLKNASSWDHQIHPLQHIYLR